jgi:hypothetical protein
MAMNPTWIPDRRLAILLLVGMAGGCGERGDARSTPSEPPGGLQSPALGPVVAGPRSGTARQIQGFERCEPVSAVADAAGRFFLAVNCMALPAGMAVSNARPAPAPAPGPPPAGAPSAAQATLSAVSGEVGASVDGGLVVRTAATARLAAGAAGHLYLVDGGVQTALQLETLFTRDGGRSWYRIASPDPDSHFLQGRVAAEGDRVLFGALDFGKGAVLELPFPTRLWGLPRDDRQPVPFTRLGGAGEDLDLALHLPRSSTTAWAARRASPRELALFTSQDGGASFPERRTLSVATELGQMAFGQAELFLVAPNGRIEVVPLAGSGANELIPPSWAATDQLRAHVVDSAGHLWALTSSSGGLLSARRLARPGTSWSEPSTLGAFDGGVQASAMPDGSLLVAFSRGGHLHVQPVAAP